MEDIIIVINNETINKYNKYYFQKYPKRKKPPIDSPLHPSMNKWIIMKRPQMNDLKQKWKEFGVWVVEMNNLSNLKINKCQITINFYFKDKRKLDLDNRSPKFLFDAFVSCELLVDDNYFHLNPLILKGNYDKDNPRMEIQISNIER